FSEEAWWFPEVLVAASTNILHGDPDHAFRPDRQVTKNECALVLARLLTYPRDLSSPKSAWRSLRYAMGMGDEAAIQSLLVPISDDDFGKEDRDGLLMKDVTDPQKRLTLWRKRTDAILQKEREGMVEHRDGDSMFRVIITPGVFDSWIDY